MARRMIKFPLKMKNGAEVRSLEELRENADVESITKYYFNKRLELWCRAYNYNFFENLKCSDNYQTLLNILSELNLNLIDFDKYVLGYSEEDILHFGSMGTVELKDGKFVINEKKRIFIEWVKLDEDEDSVLLVSKDKYATIINADNPHPVSVEGYIEYFLKYFSDSEKSNILSKTSEGKVESGIFLVTKHDCLKYGLRLLNDNPVNGPIHLGVWVKKEYFSSSKEKITDKLIDEKGNIYMQI